MDSLEYLQTVGKKTLTEEELQRSMDHALNYENMVAYFTLVINNCKNATEKAKLEADFNKRMNTFLKNNI